jgi:hypothetical protein
MKPILMVILTLTLALSACAPSMEEPVNNDTPVSSDDPATPRPEEPVLVPENGLMRGNVYIESTNLLTMESYPLQFMLQITGNLPTPCHQLRVDVSLPDAQNKVMMEVYSVTNPDTMCIQVLEPFDTNVSLGSFPAGKYTLWVNGEMIAEFQA